MEKTRQPRRPSKPMADDKRLPRSAMDTLAKGGDKESHEPLRKGLKSSGAQSTPSRKNRP